MVRLLLLAAVGVGLWAQDYNGNLGAVAAQPPDGRTYQPITAAQRGAWFLDSTAIGPMSLASGLISAGWGTAFNKPHEYGSGSSGFGKRFGMRLTGISVGNAIEAGLGSAWGEDPRYFPLEGRSVRSRIGNVLRFTFDAYRDDGTARFAYARLAGNIGNNILSNTWRARSESDWQHAIFRIGEGVLSRAASNAFKEFWPDAKRFLARKRLQDPNGG